MISKIVEYSGTVRITNPRTLQAWIDKGWFQREINNGYIYAPGCGRFRKEVCTCCKCKKPNANKEIKEVLIKNNL